MENLLGLSERTILFFDKQTRNFQDRPIKPDRIKKLIPRTAWKLGFPANHPIFAFQRDLAGCHLGEGGYKLWLGMDSSSAVFQAEHHWFCEFADYESALPAIWLMDEQGVIYYSFTYHFSDFVKAATSIRTFLEARALSYLCSSNLAFQIQAGYEPPIIIEQKDLSILHERLTKLGLEIITEASDEFGQWWLSSESFVRTHRVHDLPATQLETEVATGSAERLQELGIAFEGLAKFPTPDKFLSIKR